MLTAYRRGNKFIFGEHGICTKRKYKSKAKAKKMLRSIRGQSSCVSFYRCRFCDSWHLTSKQND